MGDAYPERRRQAHEQRIFPGKKAQTQQVDNFIQHESAPAENLTEPVSLAFGEENGHNGNLIAENEGLVDNPFEVVSKVISPADFADFFSKISK